MRNNQAGAGLIEVMVTAFILSIGLLGIASLQATGIQAGQGASLRTTALIVVEDIASRMRANKLGLFNNTSLQGYYVSSVADTGTDNGCSDALGGAAVNCTEALMAAHDIFLWKQNLSTLLPSGTGSISYGSPPFKGDGTATGLVTATITVNWLEKGVTKTYLSDIKVSTL